MVADGGAPVGRRGIGGSGCGSEGMLTGSSSIIDCEISGDIVGTMSCTSTASPAAPDSTSTLPPAPASPMAAKAAAPPAVAIAVGALLEPIPAAFAVERFASIAGRAPHTLWRGRRDKSLNHAYVSKMRVGVPRAEAAVHAPRTPSSR